MTLTIEFIKDNIPTADQQLELLKETLKFYKVTDINWLSERTYIDKSKVKRLGASTRLDNYILCNETLYLKNTIYKMFEQFAVEIKKAQITTILTPHALPTQTYIHSVQLENNFDLIGVIYFL